MGVWDRAQVRRVSGQRPENNTFYLDGVSDNNHYSTGPLAIVSNDAVAEVSMLQNQFSAGIRRRIRWRVQCHREDPARIRYTARIYEYFQNRNLNADDALYWTQGLKSFPRYDSNRLGATMGGPIFKNKLFYFGNYEYNPIGQASVPGTPIFAPTAAGYTADGG